MSLVSKIEGAFSHKAAKQRDIKHKNTAPVQQPSQIISIALNLMPLDKTIKQQRGKSKSPTERSNR